MPQPTPELVLEPIQCEVLSLFGRLPDAGLFYLAGASALAAFYLGHRRSKDLDLFTAADPAIDATGRELEHALLQAGFEVQVVRRYRTFAEFVATRGDEAARIQLAQDSPYRLEPPTRSYRGVTVDSFRDLAANKLLAAFGRAEPRDLVDVYLLIREGSCTFAELERWAHEKDPGLDAYALATALRTVDDLPDAAAALPVDLLVPLDVADMKMLLKTEAVRLLDGGLPP